MIKAFISKVAEGRSMCAIAECAAQTNKKVAFISTEMPEEKIVKRFDVFKPKCSELLIKYIPAYVNSVAELYKRVERFSEEFDLICIDSPHIFKTLNLHKLHDACFGSLMNQCEDLWITIQTNGGPANPSAADIRDAEKQKILKVKQVCRKVEHPLIAGTSLIEAVDLETKEVKTYNLSNIFKTK